MTTNKKTKTLHPLSAWQTETIRITIFHQSEEPEKQLGDIWKELIGSPYSDEIAKPLEGIKIVKGPFDDGLLSITSQGARNVFEVRWQASTNHVDPDSGYPSIGDFETALSAFNKLAKKVLRGRFISRIVRIAFGSVIQLPAKDRYMACENLAKYLRRIKLNPKRSRDILFRINEPRDSSLSIDGLSVNRINNWALVAMQSFSVNAQQIQDVGPISHGAQLELDINTCQEYKGLLPKSKLQKIYDELVQMGREIVLEGSIS